MKVIVFSCGIVAVIAVVANFVLSGLGHSTQDRNTSSSVRLDDASER